jgi:hypothetical protein
VPRSTIVVKKDFQDSLAGHRNVRENKYTKVDRGMNYWEETIKYQIPGISSPQRAYQAYCIK